MQNLLLGEKQEKSSELGFSVILVVILLAFYLVMTNVFYLVVVNGTSMNNTLSEGDVLFVNRIAKYERGDVIVFELEDNMLIKRVIAIEGDEIKCEYGVVSVKYKGEDNFVVIDEPYIVAGTRNILPTILKEGELFVLGDNRPISNDSSSFGPIKNDCVIGVVTNFSIKHKETITKIFGWAFKNQEIKG